MGCSLTFPLSKFGFSNMAELYRTVPYILLSFYILCALLFLPILIIVLKLFYKVHGELYYDIKRKMIFFYVCYIIYKGARIYLYYMIVCRRLQRNPDDQSNHFDILVISYYSTELLLSTVVLVVSIINYGSNSNS